MHLITSFDVLSPFAKLLVWFHYRSLYVFNVYFIEAEMKEYSLPEKGKDTSQHHKYIG